MRGEVHPEAGEIGARRENGLTVSPGLVGNPLRFEVADNRARVLEGEVGIEHAHRRLRDPGDHEDEEGHERERHRAHRGNPRGA